MGGPGGRRLELRQAVRRLTQQGFSEAGHSPSWTGSFERISASLRARHDGAVRAYPRRSSGLAATSRRGRRRSRPQDLDSGGDRSPGQSTGLPGTSCELAAQG